jgi:hypothetical protein
LYVLKDEANEESVQIKKRTRTPQSIRMQPALIIQDSSSEVRGTNFGVYTPESIEKLKKNSMFYREQKKPQEDEAMKEVTPDTDLNNKIQIKDLQEEV